MALDGIKVKAGSLIPFVEVPLALSDDNGVAPLKEIVIGYKQPFERAKYALQYMLKKLDYQKDGTGCHKMPDVVRSNVALA